MLNTYLLVYGSLMLVGLPLLLIWKGRNEAQELVVRAAGGPNEGPFPIQDRRKASRGDRIRTCDLVLPKHL